jgi:membrane-associated phospholipid phosphatase
MPPRRSAVLAAIVTVLLASPLGALARAADGAFSAPADSGRDVARTTPASVALFQRSDLAFAFGTAAAVLVTGHHDAWLRREAIESDTRLDRNLARDVRPLGNPTIVLPALLAGWGLARAFDAAAPTAGFKEVGLSVACGAAGALVLKEVVGRARPEDSPGDSRSFRPFSGRSSFPSGHATVAFALAESIRLSSHRRWTPWLTYPAAILVSWSRVRDDVHWTSDVVAGAALGFWTAREVHRVLPAERHRFPRLGLAPSTPDGTPGVFLTLR